MSFKSMCTRYLIFVILYIYTNPINSVLLSGHSRAIDNNFVNFTIDTDINLVHIELTTQVSSTLRWNGFGFSTSGFQMLDTYAIIVDYSFPWQQPIVVETTLGYHNIGTLYTKPEITIISDINNGNTRIINLQRPIIGTFTFPTQPMIMRTISAIGQQSNFAACTSQRQSNCEHFQQSGRRINTLVLIQSTKNPTISPTQLPSIPPTKSPSKNPSIPPTNFPSIPPTNLPSKTPTKTPTNIPTRKPTINPSLNPTNLPSISPTFKPTINPSMFPSETPTVNPSLNPTYFPTKIPSNNPSTNPTIKPTINPTIKPTNFPTIFPTNNPSFNPSKFPSNIPTIMPSIVPSYNPTTKFPTKIPSKYPTNSPITNKPTISPNTMPTKPPSFLPSKYPTNIPTNIPTLIPTNIPIISPRNVPTHYAIQTTEAYMPTVETKTVTETVTVTANPSEAIINNNAGDGIICDEYNKCLGNDIICRNGDCNIICDAVNSCKLKNIYGINATSLTVECNGKSSCKMTNFFGGNLLYLIVKCNGFESCKMANFYGNETNLLKLFCLNYNGSCQNMKVFCPIDSKQCIISNNGMNKNDIHTHLQFYAINGFDDLDISKYSAILMRTANNNSNMMHCGNNYENVCKLNSSLLCDCNYKNNIGVKVNYFQIAGFVVILCSIMVVMMGLIGLCLFCIFSNKNKERIIIKHKIHSNKLNKKDYKIVGIDNNTRTDSVGMGIVGNIKNVQKHIQHMDDSDDDSDENDDKTHLNISTQGNLDPDEHIRCI